MGRKRDGLKMVAGRIGAGAPLSKRRPEEARGAGGETRTRDATPRAWLGGRRIEPVILIRGHSCRFVDRTVF